MNMKQVGAVVGLMAVCAGFAHSAQYGTLNLANETGLAYNQTYTLAIDSATSPQGGFSRVAAQIIYGSMTPTVDSYNSGISGTGTITIVSTTPLVGAFASNKITVPATSQILAQAATAQITVTLNTGLGAGATSQIVVTSTFNITGACLTLNGAQTFQVCQGSQWNITTSSSGIADNIVTAMNLLSAYTNIVATHPVAGLTGTIYATATVNGIVGQSYTITSSTPPVLTTTTFSGGTANAILNINGNLLVNQTHWSVGAASSNTAVNICNSINTYLASSLVCTQSLTSTTIFTTATVAGSAFNGTVIIASPSLSITPSTSSYSGGHDPVLRSAKLTFRGAGYRNGYEWTDASGLSSMTAVSITNLFNQFGVVVATTAADGVIWTTAATLGSAANAFTLTSSNSRLIVSSPTYMGGQDSATLTINGYTLTAATYTLPSAGLFAIGSSTQATAVNLSSAIVNNATLNAIVISTETFQKKTYGIIWTTATSVGTSSNYTMTSSTAAILVAGYLGGTNASYTLNSPVINIPNHGYTTGLKVWQSTGTGTQLLPLVYGTTYYVIAVDANNIQLAITSTGAVAGLGITITSSSTVTTANTFTLNPSVIAGNVSWKWQVSNDGASWSDLVTPSSYTVGTNYVYPSTATVVDFGDVDYQFLRMNVVAPTAGALKLKVPVNGRL